MNISGNINRNKEVSSVEIYLLIEERSISLLKLIKKLSSSWGELYCC